mmetsp:Transcript_25846/g.53297  ORF Transcript_25846/g.53297 Transcript_25846/m.53297 type:complete len:437 (-) Transcript_25846:1339-2649(-)
MGQEDQTASEIRVDALVVRGAVGRGVHRHRHVHQSHRGGVAPREVSRQGGVPEHVPLRPQSVRRARGAGGGGVRGFDDSLSFGQGTRRQRSGKRVLLRRPFGGHPPGGAFDAMVSRGGQDDQEERIAGHGRDLPRQRQEASDGERARGGVAGVRSGSGRRFVLYWIDRHVRRVLRGARLGDGDERGGREVGEGRRRSRARRRSRRDPFSRRNLLRRRIRGRDHRSVELSFAAIERGTAGRRALSERGMHLGRFARCHSPGTHARDIPNGGRHSRRDVRLFHSPSDDVRNSNHRRQARRPRPGGVGRRRARSSRIVVGRFQVPRPPPTGTPPHGSRREERPVLVHLEVRVLRKRRGRVHERDLAGAANALRQRIGNTGRETARFAGRPRQSSLRTVGRKVPRRRSLPRDLPCRHRGDSKGGRESLHGIHVVGRFGRR